MGSERLILHRATLSHPSTWQCVRMANSVQAYWEKYENAKDINWKPQLDGWNPHSEFLPASRDPCVGSSWEVQVERVVEAILVILILVLLALIYYWKRCKRNTQVTDMRPVVDEVFCLSAPPSYDMVVKQEKEKLDDTSDLPTYWQAVKS